MPKEAPIRWDNTEIIKILNYINNNIDLWCLNHLDASLKAIKATNNNKRDAKSVYNKVHSLIKAYEEFDINSKKTPTCNIIWDDSKVHDLVRKIYIKLKNRKKKEDNQEKKKKDENQEPKERKKKENQVTTNRDDDGDVEMTNGCEPLTPNSRSSVNGQVSQIPFSAELIEKLFNEKYRQIEDLRTQLTKTVENTKSIFEKVNAQISIPSDSVNTACNEKIRQISLLRTELIEIIEKANNKYDQLKEFQ